MIFVLVVLAFLYSISGKKQPRIPDTDIHRGVNEAAVCLGCHGPGQKFERMKQHLPKDQCFECHKRKRGRQ
jgi:hypothetical protein